MGAGDKQEWDAGQWIAAGLAIAQSAAEVRNGKTKAAERLLVRPLGPQQRGQLLARVFAVALDGQVGEEGAQVIRVQACDRPVAHG